MSAPLPRYTPGSGLPPALPPATTHPSPSSQVSDASGASGGTNTPRTASAETPPARLSARRLAAVAAQLSDRDYAALRVVGEHRYLSTHQVQRFVCRHHSSEDAAARTARALTRRLMRLGLLRPLDRRIGGIRPGSTATVWQLAPAAYTLLRAEGSTARTYQPSPRFLAHCLAVADVHLALHSLASEQRTVSVETEPASWRRYNGAGGESRWLQPDLAASLATPSFHDHWFIEVDLGTESLPTLLGKCRQYADYRASGIEQERLGAFPLVLWVMVREERIAPLRTALLRSTTLDAGLFRLVGPSEVLGTLEQGG